MDLGVLLEPIPAAPGPVQLSYTIDRLVEPTQEWHIKRLMIDFMTVLPLYFGGVGLRIIHYLHVVNAPLRMVCSSNKNS